MDYDVLMSDMEMEEESVGEEEMNSEEGGKKDVVGQDILDILDIVLGDDGEKSEGSGGEDENTNRKRKREERVDGNTQKKKKERYLDEPKSLKKSLRSIEIAV